MISHRIRLDEVGEALDSLGRGDVIRQVIEY
jgi:Zn-dependent alcohol dehydrogenase